MSFDPHSRRFDPRWLFPAIETDGEETSGGPDAISLRLGRGVDERPGPTGLSPRHSSRSRRNDAVCVLSAGRSWGAMDPC